MNGILNQLSVILWTKNLGETISFYVNTLGFTCESNFPNFASFHRNHVQIMTIVPTAELVDRNDTDSSESFFPKPCFTGSIYIFMENVGHFWEEVKDKVKIESSLADREYWMRDFAIFDNNGYMLVFGEDISIKNNK